MAVAADCAARCYIDLALVCTGSSGGGGIGSSSSSSSNRQRATRRAVAASLWNASFDIRYTNNQRPTNPCTCCYQIALKLLRERTAQPMNFGLDTFDFSPCGLPVDANPSICVLPNAQFAEHASVTSSF
jgi:hypothetical protein